VGRLSTAAASDKEPIEIAGLHCWASMTAQDYVWASCCAACAATQVIASAWRKAAKQA
jgi:hypothetical protein